MSEATKELLLIKKYLLGGLEGEEREQLEERVLLDAEFRDRVLLVEENLIEDYAEGTLDEVERKSFQRMFYSNPERRLELQVVQDLKEHANTKSWTRLFRAARKLLSPQGAGPGSTSPVWGFRNAAMALALVVIVVLTFLIVQQLLNRRSTPTLSQQRRELVERELARLNYPDSQPPPAAVTATLRPGLSRGNGKEPRVEFPTVSLTRDAESAQLMLLLKTSSSQYRSFQATLSPLDEPESYQVDLKPTQLNTGERALVLTLPANLFADGDYGVQLTGRAANEQTEALPDHYYYFRLVRQ
jgi:hypothetical protein